MCCLFPPFPQSGMSNSWTVYTRAHICPLLSIWESEDDSQFSSENYSEVTFWLNTTSAFVCANAHPQYPTRDSCIRVLFRHSCWWAAAAVLLTQWSRACRKSKSSSVHSSLVCDRELTLLSHASSLSRTCTQCAVCSHLSRIASKGSYRRHTQSSDSK